MTTATKTTAAQDAATRKHEAIRRQKARRAAKLKRESREAKLERRLMKMERDILDIKTLLRARANPPGRYTQAMLQQMSTRPAPNYNGEYPGIAERLGPAWRVAWAMLNDGPQKTVDLRSAMQIVADILPNTCYTMLRDAVKAGLVEKYTVDRNEQWYKRI